MFTRLASPSSLLKAARVSSNRKIHPRPILIPLYLTVSSSLISQVVPFSTMPSPPYQYRSPDVPAFDLGNLELLINDAETKRQSAFEASRKFHTQVVKIRSDMELETTNTDKTAQVLDEISKSLKEAAGESESSDRTPREANLSNRVEEFARLVAFNHFLANGTLIAPSDCGNFVTDEEYLAGACMGLCQDVARYAIGRATARDLASVKMSRDVIQEILDYLLKFDFRNGYLRRKYDGTKYALKTVETLLYELSVTGATDTEEPDAKRTKASTLSDPEQLEEIRKRIEHRDELREQLIKKSRDGQKAAKQAIYALHRGDNNKAQRLLQQCQDCITNDLMPIVNEEPPLRSGSCSNVLEEFAEAKLFYVWLLGKEDIPSSTCSGILLKHDEFGIDLESEEYLGGLCDLTGEIGRYAVQRGTDRDFEGVKKCLEANSSILLAIQMLGRFPGGIGKKMDQLRRSVEKLERMTYELSLSEATGRKIASEAVESMDISQDE